MPLLINSTECFASFNTTLNVYTTVTPDLDQLTTVMIAN